MTATMAEFHFRCSECRAEYGETEVDYTCPECSRHQQPGREVRGVLEVVIEDLPRVWPPDRPSSGRFLEAFLPIRSAALLPSLTVGDTPLVEAHRLATELEMSRLWIKDDSRNPSGSTKDRASVLVVAKAMEYGYSTVATASTGNAATALSATAAAAGIRAVVFVPATAPRAKLIQMLVYGAQVIRVAGSYDLAFELCQQACSRFGWYNRNTALNPFTIEGKKTAALEIGRRLEETPPDVVVVPTGDGVILSGIAKGFNDLVRAGLMTRVPRLLAIQPGGSDAIVRAFDDGSDTVQPIPDAASVADSLTVQVPRNARLALRNLGESRGGAVSVDDDLIVASIGRLARTTGIFAEPAAAAALAGLEAALDEGLVDRHETVVLMATGSGLKDVPAAAGGVSIPEPVAPHIDEVASAIGAE
jgi:threonine synthase